MASMQDMTMDDVEEVERLAGMPLGALSDPSVPKGKLMKAIAFVIKRQDDPTFTIEQAGKLTMAQINEVLEGSDPLEKP